ncbi:hypothetical protein OPQ81_011435 [Rhizoctonia solani]|nr:hypothetical protein OPQ81_011435 [Rhizoctonia solani]
MGVPSRKYVDLIFKASGKYGNWDPPQKVEGIGGEIEKETGAFIREGNIFNDPDCDKLLSGIPRTQLVRTGGSEDVIRISSGVEGKIDNGLYTGLGATGELGIRAQAAWEFTPRNRAAVLTVTNAYSNYLEVGMIFPKLRSLRKLEGKAIITEALHCFAYALFLTEKGKGGKASLALFVGASEAGSEVSGGASVGWKYTSESGVWRTACALDGTDALYTPLYRIKKISRSWPPGRYRGGSTGGPLPIARSAPTDEPWSETYFPPWEKLDEDGDEVLESPTLPEREF